MNKIHVIIPVYNAERYVEQAVRSVLDQPYKGIDIVLVDDGSPDRSGEICDRLSEESDRVHVIHKENGGVSSARNVGIDYILSQNNDGFIAFLDADDLWVSSAIDEKIEEMIVGCDLVGFSCYHSNEDVTRFSICYEYEDRAVEYENRGSSAWIWGGTFGAHLYSVELLREFDLRYVNNCRFNEDLIFIMKVLFCSKKVKLCSDYLYIYRANSYSVTHAKKKKSTITAMFEVANSWHAASFWCDNIEVICDEGKANWHKLCNNLVGQRLLESFCVLSEEGLSYRKMTKALDSSFLYECLENLSFSAVSKWQQPDLVMFRESRKKAYIKYRLKGIVKCILKLLLKVKLIRSIKEKRQYPIVGISV